MAQFRGLAGSSIARAISLGGCGGGGGGAKVGP